MIGLLKLTYIMPFDPPSLILDEARKKDGTHVWMWRATKRPEFEPIKF
jgi:hypothetical protein